MAEGGTDRGESTRRRLHTVTIVLATAGIVLTALLVSVTQGAHISNENRLLRQRTREAAAALTAAIPGVETPLESAAAVVKPDASAADSMHALFGPLVATGRPFVSASLWSLQGGVWQPMQVEGAPPKLATQSQAAVADLAARAAKVEGMAVIALLDGDDPRLGYAVRAGTLGDLIVYAEAALPPNRTTLVRSDTAFAGLNNAIYLGEHADSSMVLTASTSMLPLSGDHLARETVPFGDQKLLLVMSPSTELGGSLLKWLPWLAGLVGLLTTGGAAVLTEGLARRRDAAVQEAGENAELYWAQRSVARTLQHALLPGKLPEVDGLRLDALYLAGVASVEIGGDWYDVIKLDDRRVLLVVGDVSGRGLPAANVMGSLRFAIRAFASDGYGPGDILNRLSRMLDLQQDGHFATVLCALIEMRSHTVTLASAGHPGPLLVDPSGCRQVQVEPGPPIGVTAGATYAEEAVTVPVGAFLFAFTDGLFERRGESIDDGIARLCDTVSRAEGSLDARIEAIVRGQHSTTTFDDTAILGVQWTT